MILLEFILFHYLQKKTLPLYWQMASSQINIRFQKILNMRKIAQIDSEHFFNLIYVPIFFNKISNKYISDTVDRTNFVECSNKRSYKKFSFKLKMDFIAQIESELQNFK